MRQAIGYIRVSTTGQAKEGESLPAQKARIEAWALANGFELAAVYEDAGRSGAKVRNRRGLQAALRYATENQAALVVLSLSRLSRSTRDMLALAERLERAGGDLVSLTERLDTTSAMGRMVFRMMAVLNEFEREQMAERTREVLDHKRANGLKLGGRCPYGYDAVRGKLVPNPLEQVGIARMCELRKAGASLSMICEQLEAESIQPKTGPRWRPKVVRDILKRTPVAVSP